MSSGNTINNNFNIVNNIMQINGEKPIPASQGSNSARNSQSNLAQHQEPTKFDESIIQTIVAKLGYTADEVRTYAKDPNSFVSVLY